MTLKYSYREVFRRKILRPKRLWALLEDLDSRVTGATGSDTSMASDISALKTTVGNNSSGLVKDVADLQTAVQNVSPNVTLADIGLELVEVVVTYTDNTTETMYLAKQVTTSGDTPL